MYRVKISFSVIAILFLFIFASAGCRADATQPPSAVRPVATSIPITTPPVIPSTTQESIGNLRETYNIVVLWNGEFGEIDRWIRQLEKAASLLHGKETLDVITKNKGRDYFGEHREKPLLKIEFEAQDHWRTGQYDYRENLITINITPDNDHPFPYEYVSENGYEDEEILYVWIHEMGHAWHTNNRVVNFFDHAFEEPATRYGYYDWSLENIGDTLNRRETFAESFALYVVLPQYLKENFLSHYDTLKMLSFGEREYVGLYHIPSSIYARLSLPLD